MQEPGIDLNRQNTKAHRKHSVIGAVSKRLTPRLFFGKHGNNGILT